MAALMTSDDAIAILYSQGFVDEVNLICCGKIERQPWEWSINHPPLPLLYHGGGVSLCVRSCVNSRVTANKMFKSYYPYQGMYC